MTFIHRNPFKPLFVIAMAVLFLQGCSVLQQQSNDELIATTAGGQYVISKRPDQLDVNRLTNGKGSTIMSLIAPEHSQNALASNGNSQGAPLTIKDPSSPILNRLGDYFQKKYDLKFVARGTINNIDPDYLNRQLKQGDYVIDVRLTHLELKPQENGSLFYPLATFQFSVIDHRNARIVLQDECSFAEQNSPQTVAYFSISNGHNLSAFLSRYATPCLRYFVLGEPLPEAAQAGAAETKTATQPEKQTPKTKETKKNIPSSFTPDPYTQFGLGSGISSYSDVGVDGTTLNDLSVSWTTGKKITSRNSLISRASFSVYQPDGIPTFTNESFYGASLGIGTVFHLNGDVSNGIEASISGHVSQALQKGLAMGTNAVSINLGYTHTLVGPLVGSVEYNFISHLGQATETQTTGHRLGVSLAYRFNL